MAHKSFEDAGTTAILNANFVCIKVDREERPDLDAIYMQATTSMTGSGGWPMSVFLTPDLRPFYAGTYFPPVQRYNMPAFPDLLLALAKSWLDDRERILQVADHVRLDLQQSAAAAEAQLPSEARPQSGRSQPRRTRGSSAWGLGTHAQVPPPLALEFLLRRAAPDSAAHPQALAVVNETLQMMSRGGMYDVVGGGFTRYSTDDQWLVPHFEKMLYDNAQLAMVYLHAYVLTGDASSKRVAVDTLDFVRAN